MTWCNLSAKDGTSHVSVTAPLDLSPLENKTEAAHDTLAKLAAWIADVNTDLESLHDVADGAVGALRESIQRLEDGYRFLNSDQEILNKRVINDAALFATKGHIGDLSQLISEVSNKVLKYEDWATILRERHGALWDQVQALNIDVNSSLTRLVERADGLETVIANIQIPPKFKQNHWPVVIATAVSVLASLALHYIR